MRLETLEYAALTTTQLISQFTPFSNVDQVYLSPEYIATCGQHPTKSTKSLLQDDKLMQFLQCPQDPNAQGGYSVKQDVGIGVAVIKIFDEHTHHYFYFDTCQCNSLGLQCGTYFCHRLF